MQQIARCRIFDLDGTLYARNNPLFSEIRKRTNEWLARKLGIRESDAIEKTGALKTKYPNYLARFMALGLSIREYHEGVFHNLSPESYLTVDPELIGLLEAAPGTNYVVTCAPITYAEVVLRALGIMQMINRAYSIDDQHYLKQERYEEILRIESCEPSSAFAFGDNFAVDVAPALRLRMHAFLIGYEDEDAQIGRFDTIHTALRTLYDL